MKAELEESLLIFTAKVAKKFKPEIVCEVSEGTRNSRITHE